MAQVLRHLQAPSAAGRDPNLLVGTETCDDAGVYLLSPNLALVQTVDFFPPVVDDPFTYGQIAAANALSDVYAMGGMPKTALNLVCFPDDKLPMATLSRILEGGQDRIAAANACLVGGHTVRDVEIKYGLSVTGIVDPNRMTTNAAAKPGDVLFLSKPLGTGFVTTAHKANACDDATLATACASMTRLNDTAAQAMLELGVRAATDITGFGLAGHANEMASGSNVTIVLESAALPMLPGVERLIDAGYHTRASATNADFVAKVLREEGKINPRQRALLYDAQTSGGLLMAVPESRAAQAQSIFAKHGVLTTARVGHVVEAIDHLRLIVRGVESKSA